MSDPTASSLLNTITASDRLSASSTDSLNHSASSSIDSKQLPASRSANDFVLRVRAGPSYSNLTTIRVNDEHHPFLLDSEHFTGYLVVRYLNFSGVIPEMDAALKTDPSDHTSSNKGNDTAQTVLHQDHSSTGTSLSAPPSASFATLSIDHSSDRKASLDSTVSMGTNRTVHVNSLDDLSKTDFAHATSIVSDKSKAVPGSTGMATHVKTTSTDNTMARPIHNPISSYFQGRNRRYSIMLQGRFKKEWKGDDIIFGANMASPLRTPPGASIAIRIAKWLDPSVEADLDCHEPYIYSPMVSSMNSLAVFNDVDMPQIALGQFPVNAVISKPPTAQTSRGLTSFLTGSYTTNNATKSISTHVSPAGSQLLDQTLSSVPSAPLLNTVPSVDIGPWAFHSQFVPEYTSLLFPSNTKQPLLTSYDKRKRFFADITKRNAVTFSPQNIYCMDFYDAYFDFNTVSVKLPGISLSAFKFWEGQPLRYVAMSRDRSTVFFVITFELIEKSAYADTVDFQVDKDMSKQSNVDLSSKTDSEAQLEDLDIPPLEPSS
ncbi:hypothetical protein QVD99_007608 [Batrachochytrium dendrobatidis]|nr:hypothetical protein O5D80_004994 [Batrachochytrium dendrobatidis]KAK5665993.1 hypothetical protein QVD99_007608 [Batrachochytrium dendrobatidis]